MKRAFLNTLLVLFLFSVAGFTGQGPKKGTPEKIKWYSFQEAVELGKKKPKKVFIDVYTEWCGWCKRMDATTFSDPVISKLMNKYFYPVKLDAEMKDSVRFNNVTFVNPNPENARSPHQLAYALLKGQMGYPTSVLLNEKFEMIQPLSGYLTTEALEPILEYIGGGYPEKKITFEDFKKTFKSELKKEPEKKETEKKEPAKKQL